MKTFSKDKLFMQRALDLSLNAKGKTSPNPLVGCTIVKNNTIVAEGWHAQCGADHAEMVALKKAGKRARGARMYVTLEPCRHYGRTPPCVKAIIQSGIKEVIIAMKDPNPLTDGKSIRALNQSGIKTRIGVLEFEAQRINEIFIKYITTHMPFVATKSAQTLDGKIAASSGDSKWITSDKTRAYARRIRNEFDAILVGINTVLKDDPRLNAPNKGIHKIVLDSLLKIPLNAKLFKGNTPSECTIATTKRASRSKLNLLQKRGFRIIVCPRKKGEIDLRWLFKELAKREITSILVEGGARTIGGVLKESLVDKMYFYIAPKILGDEKALSSITGFHLSKIQDTITLKNLTLQGIDQDILITGYVHRDR